MIKPAHILKYFCLSGMWVGTVTVGYLLLLQNLFFPCLRQRAIWNGSVTTTKLQGSYYICESYPFWKVQPGSKRCIRWKKTLSVHTVKTKLETETYTLERLWQWKSGKTGFTVSGWGWWGHNKLVKSQPGSFVCPPFYLCTGSSKTHTHVHMFTSVWNNNNRIP